MPHEDPDKRRNVIKESVRKYRSKPEKGRKRKNTEIQGGDGRSIPKRRGAGDGGTTAI